MYQNTVLFCLFKNDILLIRAECRIMQEDHVQSLEAFISVLLCALCVTFVTY